jgi:hypothetical protein
MFGTTIWIIIWVIVIYNLLIHVVARLLVPHMCFWQTKMDKEIPKSMMDEINKLKKGVKTKYEFLKKSYEYFDKRNRGGTFEVMFFIWRAWEPLAKSWPRLGFLHCTNLTYLQKVFLVKSGFFEEKDIKTHTMFYNFFTHNYLEAKTEKGWVVADVAISYIGVPFAHKSPYISFFYKPPVQSKK